MKSKVSVLLVVGCTALLVFLWNAGVFAQAPQEVEAVAQHCVGVATAESGLQSADEAVNDAAEPLGKSLYLPLVQAEAATQASAGDATAVRCFSSFSEAVTVATSGAVSVPADTTPETVSAAALQAPSATTIIGIMYEHVNYSGSSFIWTVNNGFGCTGFTGSYFVASPPSGWNDRVSSARAFGGCEKWYHYEHSNYGGAALVCNSSTYCRSGYGTMNDSASSWRWWRSGFYY